MAANKQVVEAALVSTIQILGKQTSYNYATLVVDTIVRKLEPENPPLAFIHISTGGDRNAVSVDDGINALTPPEVGAALNRFLERITNISNDYPYMQELWFYLNPYEAKLKEMNIVLKR